MSYVRDACESTVRRLIVQLDEHRMRAVEAFVVEMVLEQQLGHLSVEGPDDGSRNSAPGNAGPNQAGADGNGAAGHTFSPAPSASPPPSAGGVGELARCDACGSTIPDCRQIWPWLWASVAPGVVHHEEVHDACCGERCACGFLCAACIESRLGRPLTPEDYDSERSVIASDDTFTEDEYAAAPGLVAEHAIQHGRAVVVRRDGSPRIVISVPRAEPVLAGLRELRDAEVQTPGVLVEFEMEDL